MMEYPIYFFDGCHWTKVINQSDYLMITIMESIPCYRVELFNSNTLDIISLGELITKEVFTEKYEYATNKLKGLAS